jgi:hypothetical protein
MTRQVVINLTVGHTVTVATGHVCRYRSQDILGFTVIVITGGDRALNHVLSDVDAPYRVR